MKKLDIGTASAITLFGSLAGSIVVAVVIRVGSGSTWTSQVFLAGAIFAFILFLVLQAAFSPHISKRSIEDAIAHMPDEGAARVCWRAPMRVTSIDALLAEDGKSFSRDVHMSDRTFPAKGEDVVGRTSCHLSGLHDGEAVLAIGADLELRLVQYSPADVSEAPNA